MISLAKTLEYLDFSTLSEADSESVHARLNPAALQVTSDDVADLFPGIPSLEPLRRSDEYAANWLRNWFRGISELPGAPELATFRGVPIWDAMWLGIALELYRPIGYVWRAVQLLSQVNVEKLKVITDMRGPSSQGRALMYVAQKMAVPVEISQIRTQNVLSLPIRCRNFKNRAVDWSRRNVSPRLARMFRNESFPDCRGRRIIIAEAFVHNVDALAPVYNDLGRRGEADLLWLGLVPQVHAAASRAGWPAIRLDRFAMHACSSEIARRTSIIDAAIDRVFTHADVSDHFRVEGVSAAGILLPIFRHMLRHLNVSCSRYTLLIEHALRRCDAKIVVTSNDASPIGQTLAFVCKRIGIPLVYVQHGVIPNDPYAVAGRSDILLVWGQISKRALTALGNAPNQLWITGAAQYDSFFKAIGSSLPLPTGIMRDSSRPLVVYTSQPPARGIPESVYRRTIQAVLESAKQLGNFQLIVKLHPIESEFVFRDLARNYTGLSVQVLKTCDTRALISNADLVLTQYSTTGLEAILLDKPLITINLTGEPDRVPYAASGAALAVERAEDLSKAITQALFDEDMRALLADQRKRFVVDMFGDVDGRASERCADSVLRVLSDSSVAALR